MKKTVSIIGGGPASLLLASFLDATKFDVTIYERNKSLGRKFLVAGNGGFNLTHAEPIEEMVERFTPTAFLKEALLEFDNNAVRAWFKKIGIPTFIGSSKRIYPEENIKPIDVLNAILTVLKQQKIKIKYEHKFTGWNQANNLKFGKTEVESDFTVFALGGSSWKVTGSDGSWLDLFKAKEIDTVPFQASNCAHEVNWNEEFIAKHEGTPLKNIATSCLDNTQKGELVITKFGMEGNAIYALSPQIREGLNKGGKATVYIDLKPTLTVESIFAKMEKSPLRNTTKILRKTLKMNDLHIDLIKTYVSKEVFIDNLLLAQHIKKLPLEVTNTGELDEGISTVGGIPLTALTANYELKQQPNTYCIGEMVDWDAPTGGYLLQASFSMGVHLAKHLNGVG